MGSSDWKKIFQVKKGSSIFGKLSNSTHDFFYFQGGGAGGGGGFPKSQYIGGNCPKRKVRQFPDFRGAWLKKGGGVFEGGGGDTLMHTMRVM